jgi:hypothetical protein
MTADPTQTMRRCLAEDLTRRGIIGPEWRAAVERVPRHLLAPFFHHRQGDEDGRDSFLFVDGPGPSSDSATWSWSTRLMRPW